MLHLDNTVLAAAIDSYCKKEGIKKSDFHRDSKISSATLSQWRNSTYRSSEESISRIERYTGMAIEDFIKLYGGQNKNTAPEDGESIRIRELLRERPEMRILFDAGENAPTSAILEAAALIMRYKEGKEEK